MFTKTKLSISLKKAMQILVVIQGVKIEDPLIDYVFTMNAKTLSPVHESFNDKKNGLVLFHAKEKDGVLLKNGNEYVYSKEAQTKLEADVQALGEEQIEVEMLQIDISKRAAAQELSRSVKAVLLDNVFVLSVPDEIV